MGPRDGRPHRILVVDDYPDIAEFTCVLLGMRGHECRAACTGRDALAEAASFEPAIVILDLDLPDVSGYEIVRMLRASTPHRPLHIAALTGWSSQRIREAAFAAGCDQ